MNLRAIGLIACLAAGIFAAPHFAEAQPPPKLARIGVPSSVDGPAWDAFRQSLKESGYVEGRSIAFEYRWYAGNLEHVPDLAAELARLKVDLIAVTAPQPTSAVKAATSTIPVVFAAVADPVGLGIVASLARPGGNITGFSTYVPGGFAAKQLERPAVAAPARRPGDRVSGIS